MHIYIWGHIVNVGIISSQRKHLAIHYGTGLKEEPVLILVNLEYGLKKLVVRPIRLKK
jgi:hypothetical protein